VQRTGTQVAVHGNRQIIAHVGAALVAHGRVPADLSAHVPDLEDALLRLLEPEPGAAEPGPAAPGPAASGPAASGSAAPGSAVPGPATPAAASHDLTGGRR
jgi:hypothetical protein